MIMRGLSLREHAIRKEKIRTVNKSQLKDVVILA